LAIFFKSLFVFLFATIFYSSFFKNFNPDSSSRACGNCGKLLKIFTQQYFQGFLPVENPVEKPPSFPQGINTYAKFSTDHP
jgi:hypothetical protein